MPAIDTGEHKPNQHGYSIASKKLESAQAVMLNAALVQRLRSESRTPAPVIRVACAQPVKITPAPSLLTDCPQILSPCTAHFLEQWELGADFIFPDVPQTRLTIKEIQLRVCKHFKISHTDMVSARRDNEVCLPRQIAMWIAKTTTLKSLPYIGRCFGDRDHTTVLSAIRKIDRMILEADAAVMISLEYVSVQLAIPRILSKV